MVFFRQALYFFLILLCWLIPSVGFGDQVIFEENFESGWGDYWSADNGVWEIGTPTEGPEIAYEGNSCAGTNLDGFYPGNTNSNLISPIIELPEVGPSQSISIQFMQWYKYSWYGNWTGKDLPAGLIHISSFNNSTKQWEQWNVLGSISTNSSGWRTAKFDITTYSKQKIKFYFYHIGKESGSNPVDLGWYIDDIKIVLQNIPASFTGNFESGWEGWSISNGVWEVGTPFSGPEEAYQGNQCVGTELDGFFPSFTDTRLISPIIGLPPVAPPEEIRLRFWQWFSYYSFSKEQFLNNYGGDIEISSYNDSADLWEPWETIYLIDGETLSWTPMNIDLTAYACKQVKISFNHRAFNFMTGGISLTGINNGFENAGWYIDDIRLILPERFSETSSHTTESDAFEPDDTKDQAGITDLDSTIERTHSFHQSGDQDWIKLYANTNQQYIFDISDVGSRINMVFNIYDDTTDQLVKRFYVQPGCEKSVSWICPKEGLYYIATAQINPEIYGEETEYTLKIFTPFILEPQTIEIGQGSSDIITIRGGKGPFVIDSIEDESIVTAKVFTQAGAFIQINGENRGTTTLTVIDSAAESEPKTITVTVVKASAAPQPAIKTKAIIVAGGGPFPGNTLWNTTRALANSVYLTLIYQGFTDNTIHYLSPDMNVDLNGDGLYDEVDDLATVKNLQEAITTWAVDADDVVVFITDHGGEGSFRINETELLDAEDLDSWLDELQSHISGKVIVVYDACHSGSFLSYLKPPRGKERIVLSSADSGQEAYFTSFGDLSFTNFFWQHIINGMSVYNAFFTTKNSIEYTYGRQTPQMDDNGNGIGNEDDEGDLAKTTYIGKGLISGGGLPVIDGVSPEQTLEEDETTAVITAETVIDSDGINRVWAVITPPDFDPGDPDNPVLDMPKIEMTHMGDNRYQGTFDEFTSGGTYTVTLYAKDNLGSIAVPVQTLITKPLPELIPATFNAEGHLSIPCLDIMGSYLHINLALSDAATLTFQLMPDFTAVEACSPCAVFDEATGLIKINALDLDAENTIWADFMITGADPVTLVPVSYGQN